MNPLNAFRLDSKVAIVTGASSGLGADFARTLSAAGAELVLLARRKEKIDALAAELSAGGGPRVLTVETDVANPAACAQAVAKAVESFDTIDILINNAGHGHAIPSTRETPEAFTAEIEVNLFGPFWMAQACARHMPAGSSIINVASVLGHIAPRFPQASYAASKAGLLGLTRNLAQEWSSRKGIRVNALCPGYFASDMTSEADTQLREMVAANSMLGRFGERHELDGALLFLASSASTYVTGTSLIVDGGMAAL